MKTLQQLANSYKFWQYFFELSSLPRPSRQEELVCKWVIDYAKKWQIAYTQDAFGNINLRAPANRPELESLPLVAMQGHLDMVCEKDDIVHDFNKDPLKLQISEDDVWIQASGTTLGADNGIAIACQMALLDPECEVPHGPIEALFTLDEETGLNGAQNLGDNMMNAHYLINIDNSQEAMCCIGCAGGRDYIAEIPVLRQQLPEDSVRFELKIRGLAGGHSGSEIYNGRSSAIKIVERVFSEIAYTLTSDVRLAVSSIEAGDKRNAIPRNADLVFYTEAQHKDSILALKESLIPQLEAAIRSEIISLDENLSITLLQSSNVGDASNSTASKEAELVFSDASLQLVISLIRLCPHGVLNRRHDESSGSMLSTNLAAIHTDNNYVRLINNSRFSNDFGFNHITRVLDSVFKNAATRTYSENGYPAWQAVDNSPLEKLFSKYYELHNKRKVTPDIIHGGIECGIIKAKQTHPLEVICVGPEIQFLHSPKERMHIESTENMWIVLSNMLANAAELG